MTFIFCCGKKDSIPHLKRLSGNIDIRISVLTALIFFLFIPFKSIAQTSLFSTQYSDNQYIANPAMAGIKQHLQLNECLKAALDDRLNKPLAQVFTVEHGFGRSGVGLIVYNHVSELMHYNRIVATYAYHKDLNEGMYFNDPEGFHMGFSLGVASSRLNNGKTGRPTGQGAGLNGSAGIAYTSSRWGVQLSALNLTTILKRKVYISDATLFYASLSRYFIYGIAKNEVVIEPRLSYREIKGFTGMWDAGTKIYFPGEKLNLTGVYHSDKNISMGLGIQYSKNIGLSMIYSTNTSISRQAASDLETNLKIGF